ncbi:MAG: hypothetical protein OXF86_13445 [Caldilineaceae bacterium]|nr:hypothetical protein [Caldilineaceae bacterium]
MSDGPIRSESDLQAFISSVMRDELNCARKVVKQACESIRFIRPWAFEFTPASSEPPDQGYLRKVREADFVFWLIGSETTQPVVDEITECISAGRRLLAFELPSETRCEVTKNLKAQVSSYAKWKRVGEINELAQHVRDALSDELARALRDPDPPGRALKLEEMKQLSLSRCKRMWTSLSVQEEMAAELAEDQSVGAFLAWPTTGVLRVEGDQGSGKTLAAERLFQRAIDRALDDSSQPFPIFVSARDLQMPIEDYVEHKSKDISRKSVTGSIIIVDGLDEIGVKAANSLLEELSIFTDAQTLATAVVTSRPLPDLKDDIGQRLAMSTLDQQKSIDLISRIAGQELELRDVYAWSESVQDATKRPLFAIMIGSVLRASPDSTFHKPVQLVTALAESSQMEVENAEEEEVDILLQKLAVKAVSIGKRVFLQDISNRRVEQRMLANSRLVNKQEDMVDFTLPIFREWYAARALIEETVSFEELHSDSDLWVIPLAIAVDSGNETSKRTLMTKLCSSDPGLASLVLQELEPVWPPDESDEFSLGTSLDAGEKIRNAMETWGQGLGELYSIIGPVDSKGNTSTLGIEVYAGGTRIHTSWYTGTHEQPNVVELPKDISPFTYNPEWSGFSSRMVPHAELWPWFIAKDDLVNSLSNKVPLEHLALESMSIDAVQECSWAFSLGVQRRSTRRQEPISIQEILRYIEEEAINSVAIQLDFEVYLRNKHIRIVDHHLKDLAHNGEATISDPWPSEDQLTTGTHWVWEGYTSQRLLERTIEVYGGALRIYMAIVRKWFKAFGFRFQMYGCLPARLEGRITIPKGQDSFASGPVLTWRPIILSDNAESEVAFELGVPDKLHKDFRESNESKSPFLAEQRLNVFGMQPATKLACEWLSDDLQKLGWDR